MEKETTIEGVMKEFDEKFKGFILQDSEEHYRSFDLIKSFLRSALSAQKEEIGRDIVEEIKEVFAKHCIVNKFGEHKYWNPESFGYKSDDNGCSMDKLFPEELLQSIVSSITNNKEKK